MPEQNKAGLVTAVFDPSSVPDGFEEAWDALYAADPEAQFFLSRAFMTPILSQKGPVFRHVTIWNGDRLVGLFSVRLDIDWDKNRDKFFTEVNMPGSRVWADYTGFLIDPDFETEAVSQIAQAILKCRWSLVWLKNWRASETRRETFLAHFKEPEFKVRNETATANDDETNNLRCPRIALPDDFDEYLAGLSRNTRQKLRRLLRDLDAGKLTQRAGTVDDIETVTNLWQSKWADRKGDRIDGLLDTCRGILNLGLSNGTLEMPILERDGKIIAALASFHDTVRMEILFFLAARDEEIRDVPVGLMLHADAIRRAISQGYKVYDFLRGDEPYKMQLGGVIEDIHYPIIGRNPNSGPQLDPLNVPGLLRRVPQLIDAKQFEKAKIAAVQVHDLLSAAR